MEIISVKNVMPAPFGFGQITNNPDYYYADDIKPYLVGYLPIVAEIKCDGCVIIVFNAANYYGIKVKTDNEWEVIGTRLFINTISPKALCKEAETLLRSASPIV